MDLPMRTQDIVSLDTEVATKLAMTAGRLDLSGLKSISGAAAKALASFRGDEIDLSGLTSLSDEAAEALLDIVGILSLSSYGRHFGADPTLAVTTLLVRHAVLCDGAMSLGGVRHLSPVVARELSKVAELCLDGLSSLSAAAADALSEQRGVLSLDGLEVLPDDVAIALGRHQGDLSLRGLKVLSEEAAEALGGHSGGLILDGLTTLSVNQARFLALSRGPLRLNGLSDIDHQSLMCLSEHRGALYLGGLTSLSDAQADVLSRHGGGELGLGGVSFLSGGLASTLARRRAPLSLGGIWSLTDEVADALAGNGAVVELPGLRDFSSRRVRALIEQGLFEPWLPRINRVDDELAEALARSPHGFLHLSGVESLPASCARILHSSGKILVLENLRSLRFFAPGWPVSDTNGPLEEVVLEGLGPEVVGLPNFGNHENLAMLRIRKCGGLKKLEFRGSRMSPSPRSGGLTVAIEECPRLEEVVIVSRAAWGGSAVFRDLPYVRRMHLSAPDVENLQALSGLRSLQDLVLDDCPALRTLRGIDQLHALRALTIKDCSGMQTIDGIEFVPKLVTLRVLGSSMISDIRAIARAAVPYCTIETNGLAASPEVLESIYGHPFADDGASAVVLPDFTVACHGCGGGKLSGEFAGWCEAVQFGVKQSEAEIQLHSAVEDLYRMWMKLLSDDGDVESLDVRYVVSEDLEGGVCCEGCGDRLDVAVLGVGWGRLLSEPPKVLGGAHSALCLGPIPDACSSARSRDVGGLEVCPVCRSDEIVAEVRAGMRRSSAGKFAGRLEMMGGSWRGVHKAFRMDEFDEKAGDGGWRCDDESRPSLGVGLRCQGGCFSVEVVHFSDAPRALLAACAAAEARLTRPCSLRLSANAGRLLREGADAASLCREAVAWIDGLEVAAVSELQDGDWQMADRDLCDRTKKLLTAAAVHAG